MTSASYDSHTTYRPDIDGLRAIAVMSVLGFHLFPEALTGGFVGVDIFFVISGYLISLILLADIQGERFSLIRFYERRARRIFPALIVVFLALFIVGWHVLLAEEYRQLGKHSAAGAGFVQNLVLWKESGYFDQSGEKKLLLHLWSLAVEEQFYIFWPLLMYFAATRRLAFPKLALSLAGISLFLCVYFSYSDRAASYYSPVVRFWELMAGGILAHLSLQQRQILWRAGLSASGALLLVLGLALIDKHSAFPGFWALLPTVGTVFLIAAGKDALVNRQLLSHPWLVGIGLISYPLYLWHWPLISLSKTLFGNQLSYSGRLGILAASLVLAWLTYRWVETPIRVARKPKAAAYLFAGLVMLGAFGVGAFLMNGFPSRVINQVSQDRSTGHDGGGAGLLSSECVLATEDRQSLPTCVQDARGEPRFALLGDSKAGVLYEALFRTSPAGASWVVLAGNGLVGASNPLLSDHPAYAKHQRSITTALNYVLANDAIEVVVFASASRVIFKLGTDRTIEGLPSSTLYAPAKEAFARTIGRLVDAGKRVILLIDNPTLLPPEECVVRHYGSKLLDDLLFRKPPDGCSIDRARHLELSKQYRDLIFAMVREFPDHVQVFDPLDILCEEAACRMFKNGRILYGGTDHLSDYAAGLVGQELNRLVQDSRPRGN